MRLTLFRGPELKGRGRVGWVLERGTSSIRPSGSRRRFKITRKAVALLLRLASRRLDNSSGASLGWVDLSEISNLKEWAGARTLASLAAQVRREIKVLHRVCPNLVETPQASQLKGPFRLCCVPRADRLTQHALAELFEPVDGTVTSSESLYSWLEHTEPVWRSFHYFDKPGEALSSLPTIDDMISGDPLVKALAYIGSARRLRELGAYVKAKRALEVAVAAARDEPYLPVRQQLQALCSLQRAWLNYRTGHLDAAERWLASADFIASNTAQLKLRGQGLSLRSLVRRSRGLYAAALNDLWHAARVFVLEGDLFQLFAVYHNLACLIAAEAEEHPDASRRDVMFRQALIYSQRNEAYCRRYGIGANSVLNKLLQVGLHRVLGDSRIALRVAGEAERMALDAQNFPDAMKAHRHRVSLLLERQLLREAKEVHDSTRKALRDPELKRQCAKIYDEELARRIASSLPADRANSGRLRRAGRTPRA